jgi:hypothetical protein
MSLILSGTDGLSDVDGSAATPAIRGTDANTGIFFPAADTIAFAEGGVESMRLDSAGNLGLGVTPSAWQSGFKAIQLSGLASWNVDGSTAGSATYFGNNVYRDSVDSRWEYIASGDNATQYLQASGQHIWRTAASGTAGNAISFTQAMTLDASGNLGIGATSITANLQIQRSSPSFWMAETTSGTLQRVEHTVSSVGVYNQNLNWNAGSASRAFTWSQGGTENMRIDSSGNFAVGNSSGISRLQVFGSNAQNLAIANFRQDGSTANIIEGAVAGGTLKFVVAVSGNVTNTNNSYGAISDIKRKENITDATPKLDKLNQVRVVNFNMIGEEQKQLGVIAQELEQVFPSLIEETPDRDVEGNDLGTTTKSVKYSVFVPMLIKAMQEQQALITQLTARITALESA